MALQKMIDELIRQDRQFSVGRVTSILQRVIGMLQLPLQLRDDLLAAGTNTSLLPSEAVAREIISYCETLFPGAPRQAIEESIHAKEPLSQAILNLERAFPTYPPPGNTFTVTEPALAIAIAAVHAQATSYMEDEPSAHVLCVRLAGHTSDVVLRGVRVICPPVPKARALQLAIRCATGHPCFRLDRVSSFLQHVVFESDLPPSCRARIALAGIDENTPSLLTLEPELIGFFTKLFPGIEPHEIISTLEKNKWLIPNVLKEFEQTHSQRQPPAGSTFGVVDHTLMVAVRAIDQEKQRRECHWCKSARAAIECVSCQKGHTLCANCVTPRVARLVKDGRSDFLCAVAFGPFGVGCDALVSHDELGEVLQESLFKGLCDTAELNRQRANSEGSLVHCVSCGTPEIPPGNAVVMECSVCRAKTCTCCQEEAHPGLLCRLLREERQSAQIALPCPNCGARMLKDRGCNKLECTDCHQWMCWKCKRMILDGFHHFWLGQEVTCPEYQCPLWAIDDVIAHLEL
jgi:hypothetical protein